MQKTVQRANGEAASLLQSNALLNALSPELKAEILENAEFLDLAVRDPVYRPGQQINDVFFPFSCVISIVTRMKDGNAHSPYNLPIVLAGRASGKLATGRHLAYAKNTPLCDLYRGIAIRLGIPAEHFGDSDGELPGLADTTCKGAKSA